MTEGIAILLARANESIARIPECSKQLDLLHKNTPEEEQWFSDSLSHLFSELIMGYTLLVETSGKKVLVPMCKPPEMAWRARNLLEISIWIQYFLQHPTLARSLYEDKTRDFVDWVKAAENLEKVVSQAVGQDVKAQMIELGAVRTRTLQQATEDGIADAADPFTRISDAADTLGCKEAFVALNKLLSKFAHPTAMTMFIYADELHATFQSTVFLVFGATFFVETFAKIEIFAKEANGA